MFLILNFVNYTDLFLNFFNHLFESMDNILFFKNYDFSLFFHYINSLLYDFLYNIYNYIYTDFKLIKGVLMNLNKIISKSFVSFNYT